MTGGRDAPPAAAASAVPAEVRFSLARLLEEVKAERAGGGFSQEKLAQAEISKLFKGKVKKRRVKSDG